MPGSSGAVIKAVGTGFFKAPPKAHPSYVYVVPYRDGTIRSFSGVPSASDRLSSDYCFMVDISEQHVTSTCTVTSSVDAYSFSADLSATWRVTDPVAVVRANVSDAHPLVLGTVQDLVWQIGRTFPPDRAAEAESAARARLARGMSLGNGITVLQATARFRADAAIAKAIADTDQDAHQAALDSQRLRRLQEMFDGSDHSALLLHLLQHPDDTASVLAMIKAARDQDQGLRLGLLDRLLANNLMNETDSQPLRDIVLGQPSAGSVTMVPIASRPPLGLPRGITVSGSGMTGGSPASSQPPAGSRVAQGYVIEDVPVTGQGTGSPGAPAGAGPGKDPDPDSPAAGDPGTAAGSARGGVRSWKPIKKPGQDLA